ncbi:MAG TPA: FHA domain-containing protein [Polyangiaceae bacterium]|nr:FHA domain-containing protein [Polyangiaceae bacterium]
MWTLTIMDDEGKQTQLPLSRGEYAIGRAEENTVRLTDRNISRKHLMLRRNGDDGWLVEDLDSYNGCFVNGMRVSGTHPLYHGDLLQLGDYRLELRDESALVDASGEKTQEILNAPVSTLLDRPDRLVVVDGVAAGTEYPLEGERIIIGRAEEADISINHSSVSRTHAEIVNLGAGIYELFDRGSSNGVRVNGTRFERRVIEDDDEIELGDVRLRFVARGRIFRPGGPPRSFNYSTATSSAPGAVRRKGSMGVMIAVGAALGVAVVIGFAALRSWDSSPSGASTERVVEGQSVLEEAKRLFESGNIDGAHAKLSQLPDGSPLRDSNVVRDIEGKWADDVFARAATTSDLVRRRAWLEQVSSAPLVDAERRKRAADMIAQMDTGGTDIGSLPVAEAKVKDAGRPTVLAANPFDEPKTPGTAKTGKPSSTSTDVPATPPTTTSTTGTADNAREAILTDNDGESRARRMLEPKVWSGRATVDEIKMLRAICRHQRDSACVAKCTALLKQKQE